MAAVQVLGAVRSKIHMRRPAQPPLCLLYGNCQAEALRVLLERSPTFRSAFRTQALPSVHEAAQRDVKTIRRLISRASLVIGHRVRDGYHGLALGLDETLRAARDDVRVMTIPVLWYDGVYPFQIHVRDQQGNTVNAPYSVYHDLRFLYCAAAGWSLERSLAWLGDLEPSAGGIQALAARARTALLKHEQDVDVRVAERLLRPALHGRSFVTVNHPTNVALAEVSAQIHAQLGLPYEPIQAGEDLLGVIRTPLEPSVIAALKLRAKPREDWTLNGCQTTVAHVLTAHLSWYARNPGLAQHALTDHEERIQTLGLAP